MHTKNTKSARCTNCRRRALSFLTRCQRCQGELLVSVDSREDGIRDLLMLPGVMM